MIEYKLRTQPGSEWTQQAPKPVSWLRAEGKSPRAEGHPTLPAHSPFGPLAEILVCDEDVIPRIGAEVVRWLDYSGDSRPLVLEWLVSRYLAGSFQDRRIEEHNRVAVLELLAREHFLQASTLIQRYLSLPVSKYHLFILPLIRIPRLFDKDDSISAAREIARLYIDSVGVQFEPKWRERFTVEVFHTLSEISPDVLINTIGKLLDEVGEFELTAVLESVCKAARRSDAISLSKAPLKASALKLWNRYTTGVHVKDTDNRPGIMGRLLEILGRSGFEVEDLMQQIAESPIKPQILYQFVQRPLDFLATQRKLTLFMLTLQHMVETKQFFAAKRFTRDVLLPSIGPGFEEGLFRRILSPSQEETR